MVRVPATQYHLIARPLDVGAMGIMVPMVETRGAGAARSCSRPSTRRRAPAGPASASPTTTTQGATSLEKMQRSQRASAADRPDRNGGGLENVDAIAAVDGIDVLWIGHFDLTNSMGIPAQFDHPDYLEAVDRVVAACNRHGKAAGFMVGPGVEGAQTAALEQGFRAIAYWGDLWLFQQALRQGLEGVRAHVREPVSTSGSKGSRS